MQIEEWNALDRDKQETLINEVFNSVYLAVTHAAQNPETDAIIQEVLRVTTIVGGIAYIKIYKTVKL